MTTTQNQPTFPPEQAQEYERILAAAQRAAWRIDDLIGADFALDFSRPFLPEGLARAGALEFLDARERVLLSQVRGHAYLCIFGVVEEFILPFVLDHVRSRLVGQGPRVRALLGFAEEEAKHIELFRRFRERFERGSGRRFDVIGPPEAVAEAVLAHDPLGVALAILHIELMTQRHWIECVHDDSGLEPHVRELLRAHWAEEAQHAKLDRMMVEALAEGCDRAAREHALEQYLAVVGVLDAGLAQQVELDLAGFESAAGRVLDEQQRERFRQVQRGANRWTYLGSGMSHPAFLECVESLLPGARARLEAQAALLS